MQDDPQTSLRDRSHRAQQLARDGMGPMARALTNELIAESKQLGMQPNPLTGQLLIDRAWIDVGLTRPLGEIAADLESLPGLITALDPVFCQEAAALAERLWQFWRQAPGPGNHQPEQVTAAHTLWVEMLKLAVGEDHPRLWQARSLRPEPS